MEKWKDGRMLEEREWNFHEEMSQLCFWLNYWTI